MIHGYTRVSTDKQDYSLPAQEEALRNKAKELGLEIVIHQEKPTSGSKSISQRPALYEAIASCKKGDVLLVYCLDRLARELVTQLVIEEDLKKRGIKLLSCCDEGTVHDTLEAKMMRIIIGAFAEYERGKAKLRTVFIVKHRRSNGLNTGHLPYGIRKGSDNRMIIDDQEFKVIEEMKFLRASGYGYARIAQELNKNGILTRVLVRDGKKTRGWNKTQVKRVLQRDLSQIIK